MPQYLILAYDGQQEGALEHRMKIRPLHLEYVKKYKAAGNLLIGGAQLNSNNQMKGSAAIFEFENETQLQEYLDNEPYIINKVWVKYEVIPFKVANIES